MTLGLLDSSDSVISSRRILRLSLLYHLCKPGKESSDPGVDCWTLPLRCRQLCRLQRAGCEDDEEQRESEHRPPPPTDWSLLSPPLPRLHSLPAQQTPDWSSVPVTLLGPGSPSGSYDDPAGLRVRHPGRQHHPPPHPGLHAEVHRDHPQPGDGVRVVGPPASLSVSAGVAPGNYFSHNNLTRCSPLQGQTNGYFCLFLNGIRIVTS